MAKVQLDTVDFEHADLQAWMKENKVTGKIVEHLDGFEVVEYSGISGVLAEMIMRFWEDAYLINFIKMN